MAKRQATDKQLEALAKGREKLQQGQHGRKRHSLLSGIGSFALPSWEDAQILSVFEKAGLFLIGYIGGKETDRRFIKSGDQTGFKKFIGPVLTAGGGILLANQEGEVLRYIGYGLTTAGAVTAVNNALGKGKDITNLETLKGFSLGDLLSGKAEFPVYRDPVILKLPPYKPSLPDLDVTEKVSGAEEQSKEEPSVEELKGEDDETTLI
ncbi:MAG: hypothetical protein WC223_10545 [Bacteroidales bacterium]|jgi:hypothetical protein